MMNNQFFKLYVANYTLLLIRERLKKKRHNSAESFKVLKKERISSREGTYYTNNRFSRSSNIAAGDVSMCASSVTSSLRDVPEDKAECDKNHWHLNQCLFILICRKATT